MKLDILGRALSLLDRPGVTPQDCLALLTASIAETLPLNRSRVVIWIQTPPSGLAPLHAAAGISEMDAPAKLVFSRKLSVRGVNYGHFQVELLDMPARPGILVAALEGIAIQTAQRAELWRMEHRSGANRPVAAARSSRPVRSIANVFATGWRLLGSGQPPREREGATA